MTIAELILEKLKEHGCQHVAGIPGTSCADFFKAIDQDGDVDYILASTELEAGYFADGYGRAGGLGAVCVSYGVGTLSLVNAIASAYTERVPIVIINGGPTSEDLRIEDELGCLYSHSTGSDKTDLKVFGHITSFAGVVEDLSSACSIINDAFLSSKQDLRPVYLEIPQDLWNAEIESLECNTTPDRVFSDNGDYLQHLIEILSDAESPVFFIGVEIVRKRLSNQVIRLVEKFNIPFTTTSLAKSCIPESHPLFIGCYDSDLFHSEDRFRIVDESDCIIALGCIWGIDHRAFISRKYSKMSEIRFGEGRIADIKYKDLELGSFLIELEQRAQVYFPLTFRKSANVKHTTTVFGHDQVFSTISKNLKGHNDLQVVIDTCLGSFPGADLEMPDTDMYLANPVWLSIGQGTPAAIGAYFKSRKRPMIITGDGGFQIVAQAFSTMVRYRIPALIIVLDNSLYAIEQFLIKPSYFSTSEAPLRYVELNGWAYELFPSVFRGGYGSRIKCKDDLDKEIQSWLNADDSHPWIIACEIPPRDLPSTY